MSDLLKLSLDEVSAKLKGKEVSATELAQEALAACQAAQPALNAFTAFDEEKTMAMAKLRKKFEVWTLGQALHASTHYLVVVSTLIGTLLQLMSTTCH